MLVPPNFITSRPLPLFNDVPFHLTCAREPASKSLLPLLTVTGARCPDIPHPALASTAPPCACGHDDHAPRFPARSRPLPRRFPPRGVRRERRGQHPGRSLLGRREIPQCQYRAPPSPPTAPIQYAAALRAWPAVLPEPVRLWMPPR